MTVQSKNRVRSFYTNVYGSTLTIENGKMTSQSNSSKQQFLVDTNTAAEMLCFKPQTLRVWAMNGSGKIQPVRLGNRLRWRLTDIERLVSAA